MQELHFKSVSNERFHEDICRQIARHIIRGELQPGEPLQPESTLIHEFGVSRAVVREALRSLEQRGLVEMRQGRRTQVSPRVQWNILDPFILTLYREEGMIQPFIRDFIWIRQVLEPEVAAEAARNSDEACVAELQASVEAMATQVNDQERFYLEDRKFHMLLAEASGNVVLTQLMGVITHLFNVSRDHALERHASLEHSLAGHRRIFEEVRAKNPEGAREAMAVHIRWKVEQLFGTTTGTSSSI